MGKFKEFLKENEDILQQIYDILDELTEEEISDFGWFLYNEFFDVDEPTEEDDFEDFDIDDVKEMITDLGVEMYEDILDLLLPDDEEDVENEEIDSEEFHEIDPEDQEIQEGVSKRMKAKNFNRKKRKFMKVSKAELRRTKTKRKQLARKTRAKRKRYYRVNKNKIKQYQKSRDTAIKKGKHKVKIRRQA